MNCCASRHAVTVVGDRDRDLDSPRTHPVRDVNSATICPLQDPATLLAFKVTMNNFDVTDDTAAPRMTPEHRQSQASDRGSASRLTRWCFLSQPFFVAETFTGTPGKFVEFGNHYSDVDEMLSETFDDIPSPFSTW